MDYIAIEKSQGKILQRFTEIKKKQILRIANF